MFKRLRSLWYVLTMPSSGLPETLETLFDLRTFWRERDAYVPEPPQSQKITQPMRIVGSRKPSPIVIWDDTDEE